MTDCATVFMFTFHRQTEIGGIEPVSVGYTSVSVSVSLSLSCFVVVVDIRTERKLCHPSSAGSEHGTARLGIVLGSN